MIVVDRRKMKFLLAGRELEVTMDAQPKRPYRVHHVYAVGITGKRGTCHAEVLEVTVLEEGVRLRIRHAPGGADRTRFLARKSGYTVISDPLDAGAVPPVSAVSLIAADARARFAATRAQDVLQQRLRSLAIRLRAASKLGDLEAVREIRRELEDVERDAA